MTTNYCAAVMLLLALPAQAEEQVETPVLASGSHRESLQVDGGTMRISAVPSQPLQVLIELPQPAISRPSYALKGMIRHEGVDGDGFLQLDNYFGEHGTYFTRSLAESGPLKKISGSSGWRAFTLPFHARTGEGATAKTLTPERLTLSLFLPGNGTVFIRDVALFEYAAGEDPLTSTTQWFSARVAALFGAVGGSIVGLWGALIGLLASRGKARGFVLGSSKLLLACGVVCLLGGIVALATDQPYAVYYPLLLIGIILVFVLGGLIRNLPKRYEALELQKMRAMDA